MTERTTQTSVQFAHPFRLPGIDGLQPPGAYEVETVEEIVDGLSFVAYRRVSTTIALRGSFGAFASLQLSDIDPANLATALKQDAEASHGRT